jgi:hypothetical protein
MKIKEGFMLRKVAGDTVVVPTGKATLDFNGMITLNETGAFLWKALQNETDEDALIQLMLKEYEADENTVRADLKAFINKLEGAGLLE